MRYPDPTYRADIDGLRAIAILPILLLHLGWPGFAGGFVGVDIFFVISGTLITGLIARDIESGHFSLSRFYERRIRRIFPALIATLVATTLAASVFLLPMDLKAYGDSLMGASGFYANLAFWRQIGYFDTQADIKPLLHTWSLAVEEQYYLLFPLLLMLTHRCRLSVAHLVVALLIMSFGFNLWLTPRDPDATFYLLPTRAWELLAGAALAAQIAPSPKSHVQAESAGILGLAMVALAIVSFDSDTPFPGLAATLPCSGTALILWAGSGEAKTSVTRFLSTRLLVQIGLLSYSLYLWHWPIIALARYQGVDLNSLPAKLLLLIMSVVIAVLSLRFIERPLRKSSILARKSFSITAAVTTMTLIGAGWFLSGDGLLQRYPESLRTLMWEYASETGKDQAPMQDRAGPPQIAVWGDSYTSALFAALTAISREKGPPATSVFSKPGCRPIIDVYISDDADTDCHRHNVQVMSYLEKSPEGKVILIARWPVSLYGDVTNEGKGTMKGSIATEPGRRLTEDEATKLFVEKLGATIERLKDAGKEVILIEPIIEHPFNVPRKIFQLLVRGETIESLDNNIIAYKIRYEHMEALFDELAARHAFTRVRPRDALCREWRCAIFAQGHLLYNDNSHLSLAGSARLAPSIATALGN